MGERIHRVIGRGQAALAATRAIGKLNLVFAEGKEPRLVLDSSVCNANQLCRHRLTRAARSSPQINMEHGVL